MGTAVKVVWKGTTTTYKLAVDEWAKLGGGLAAATGGLKAAGAVAKIVPYVSIVFDMFSMVSVEERFKQLEKAIAELRMHIANLYEQIEALALRLALIDSNMKSTALDTIAGQLAVIVEKAQEPDVTPRDLKNYCIDLAELADRFLASGTSTATGEKLPFDRWRSVAFHTVGNPPKAVAKHDVFTTWPALGLYSTIIVTWMTLRDRARKAGVDLPVQDARARERHAAALSVRPGFDRLQRIDHGKEYTLLEYALLHVRFHHTAARRGTMCVLTASVDDRMGDVSYTQDVGSFESGNGFCSLDNFHVTADEQPTMVHSIEELAGIGLMRRLGVRLQDKPVWSFGPSWPRPLRLDLYTVDAEDNLQQFWTTTMSDLRDPIDWQRAPERVGNGWGSFRAVVAGTWNGLYAVQPDGAVLWYEHTGHNEHSFQWAGPHVVDKPQLALHRVEHTVGSDDGGLYQMVFIPGGPGREPGQITRPTRQLWYRPRVAGASPPRLDRAIALNPAPRLYANREWREYTQMFAGGEGAFYGIDAGGRLYWHHHDRTTNRVQGPVAVGDNWNRYSTVFAGRDGILFGIDTDGAMNAHTITEWEELGNRLRRPKRFGEENPVLGPPQWGSHKRFVPVLGWEPVIVR